MPMMFLIRHEDWFLHYLCVHHWHADRLDHWDRFHHVDLLEDRHLLDDRHMLDDWHVGDVVVVESMHFVGDVDFDAGKEKRLRLG